MNVKPKIGQGTMREAAVVAAEHEIVQIAPCGRPDDGVGECSVCGVERAEDAARG